MSRLQSALPLLAVGLILSGSPRTRAADAGSEPPRAEIVRKTLLQAELLEQHFEWDKACALYEEVLRTHRDAGELRPRYLRALRRSWQVRRHRDTGFRKEVLSLDYAHVMRLFGTIEETLTTQSVDRKNVEPAHMLQRGVEELSHALADPQFCAQYLPGQRPEDVRAFREHLQRTWGSPSGLTRHQLKKQVREIALSAQNRLQLSSSVTVLELAAGACYAFDEYTVYLTPSQYRELVDSLKGEYVGVGLTLGLSNGKLVIAEVAPFSSAAEVTPPLMSEDQILSIDRKAITTLTPENALALLEGPAGSSVELEVYTPASGMRTLTLKRRALFVPSVSYQMQSAAIGYLHIACFQDTTLQEVDDALIALEKGGMKVLVLDLRGNLGGLFEVAVEVARRFLASGIVVSTQTSEGTGTLYQARNPGALGIPLVVLVDSDTASSAEVLAGALKDNKRGRLVGQTTFGKGCTQSIVRLTPAAGGVPTGGLRVTVARFFAPSGLAYSGRGVAPHLVVERFLMGALNGNDQQLQDALSEAQRLLAP